MSYVLGLSFEYHRYRHDATIKIYADDYLVDELCLGESIRNKLIDKSKLHTGTDFIGPSNFCHIAFMPEKLYLFEIDEAYLGTKISIQVENDNNNYNNGFMTKFSYIRFFSIFLIPDWLMSLKNWRRINQIHCRDKAYQKKNTFPTMFDMDHAVVVTSNISIDQNGQNIKSGRILRHNIGGSFGVEFPVYTKHRTRHIGKPTPGKIRLNRDPALLLSLFGALNTSA